MPLESANGYLYGIVNKQASMESTVQKAIPKRCKGLQLAFMQRCRRCPWLVSMTHRSDTLFPVSQRPKVVAAGAACKVALRIQG